MAWVEVRKPNDKESLVITEEVFNDIYRLQGYSIVDKAENSVSTAQNDTVDKSAEPIPQMPSKRQYTRRNSVENK